MRSHIHTHTHKRKRTARYEISNKIALLLLSDSNYIHMHIVLQCVWQWWRRRKRTRWTISWENNSHVRVSFTLDRLHPIIALVQRIIWTRNGAPASTLRINSSVRFGSMDFLIGNQSNKNERMSEIHTQRESSVAKIKHAQNQSSSLSLLLLLLFQLSSLYHSTTNSFRSTVVWECITMKSPNRASSISFLHTRSRFAARLKEINRS